MGAKLKFLPEKDEEFLNKGWIRKSIWVEDEVVKQALDKWKKIHFGKKLSPLINQLLKEWIKEVK